MKRKLARLTSVATAIGVVALGAVVVTPGSAMAAAATKCANVQKKEFDTIGPNLDLAVTMCVRRTAGNNYTAYADIAWNDGGGGASTGMEDLVLNLRLERNNSDYRNENVSIKGAVNLSKSGSTRIATSSYHSTTTGGWTADGHIKWDIQNDGAGGGTWSLGGSPSI